MISDADVFSAEPEQLNRLISIGKLESLDRLTISQTIKEIIVHEEKQIEIVYLFSDELDSVINLTDGV